MLGQHLLSLLVSCLCFAPLFADVSLWVHNVTTLQKSTLLDRGPERAVDGDNSTCSLTGIQEGAWWRMDLQAEYNITAVRVRGRTGQPFEIRIGNNALDMGFRNGFEGNPLCAYLEGMPKHAEYVFPCRTGYRVGRHVSIMNNERKEYTVLELCYVDIIIA